MPFGTFIWAGGSLRIGTETPEPELRQIGAKRFLILKSFCYRAPRGDPDEGDVYVIPGEDLPPLVGRRAHVLDAGVSEGRVVVPPDLTTTTDLASVPSVFWWLIASYGDHTRAALLHDALYVDEGEAPVPRKTADRLFLSALRESPDKGGRFRHWLMWAAVSAFGAMPYRLGLAFALHVVAVWALTIGAVAWAWSDGIAGIQWAWWQVVLLGAIVLASLVLLGALWRLGVDVPRGWLAPTLLTGAVVVFPLAIEWPSPFALGASPFTLLAGAGVLVLLGPLWGLWVDPTLRGWLWPTAVIGLPLALVPVVLVLVALFLVSLIDLGAALTATRRTTPRGEPGAFAFPTMKRARVAL